MLLCHALMNFVKKIIASKIMSPVSTVYFKYFQPAGGADDGTFTELRFLNTHGVTPAATFGVCGASLQRLVLLF